VGAVTEGLVRRVATTAEAGGWTLVRNLVPFNVNNGEIALDAE
jgi:hypothetical protein